MRRTLGLLGCVGALALLSAGCFWPMAGQGPNRQSHNLAEDAIGVDTVASLEQKWQATVDEGAVGDPITTSAGVHVNDLRAVYGFDTATGTRNWRYGVTAPGSVRHPREYGGRVRFGLATGATATALDESTVELDAATGALLATQDEGFPLAARGSRELQNHIGPCLTGCGTAASAAAAPPNNLRAFSYQVVDLTSGEVLCCTTTSGGLTVGVPLTMPDSTLGSLRWFDADWGGMPPPDSNVTPAVRGYEIANPQSCNGSPADVCPNWATVLPDQTGVPGTVPVLSDDESTIYVGSLGGTMYALATDTGAILWSTPVGSAVKDSPALAFGSLYVPTASGDLVVLDAATGAHQWSGSTGSEITQQPAVAGGVVFTGSADGAVTAFEAAGCGAETCDDVWSRSTGSRITGAPAVSQGQLYVGTQDGRLVAFGL